MGAPPPPDNPAPEPEPPAPPEVPSPPTEACPPVPAIPIPAFVAPGVGLALPVSSKGFALCGFELLPPFSFNEAFAAALPPIDFPPLFFFALCLNCGVGEAFDAEFGFGGGRVPGQIDPDADDEFKVE